MVSVVSGSDIPLVADVVSASVVVLRVEKAVVVLSSRPLLVQSETIHRQINKEGWHGLFSFNLKPFTVKLPMKHRMR